jgi:hypothetical protein
VINFRRRRLNGKAHHASVISTIEATEKREYGDEFLTTTGYQYLMLDGS